MGSLMSKKSAETSAAAAINLTTQLNSYEAACRLDKDLQSIDTTLQARTSHVINTLTVGVEVRALSFDSLKEVTECLLKIDFRNQLGG